MMGACNVNIVSVATACLYSLFGNSLESMLCGKNNSVIGYEQTICHKGSNDLLFNDYAYSVKLLSSKGYINITYLLVFRLLGIKFGKFGVTFRVDGKSVKDT